MFSTKRKRKKIFKKFEKVLFKFAPATLLITGMLIFNVFPTNAYFSASESSTGNIFQAGVLNINISGRNVSGAVLPGNTTATTITLSKTNPANLDYQYFASTTILDTDQTACDYITISASSSPQNFSGPLKNFVSGASTPVGPAPWDFTFSVASGVALADLGKICNFKISYIAWQTNLPNNSQGFSDIAEMTGSIQVGVVLTVPEVVLNEFLPNPNGFEYGFDFGADGDSMPKGEWVELYNNSDKKIDLNGWYIWDNSGDIHHKVYVSIANTNLATTTIQTHGWLVVYMNHEILNNSEDIITLYNNSNIVKDSYHYKGRDYLDLEPTPGSKNATTTSGTSSTADVPGNKSYARIPDGSSNWVDPIPTPGEPNKMEEISDGGSTNTLPIATTTELVATSTDPIASTTSEIASTTPEVIMEEPIIVVSEPVIIPEPIIELTPAVTEVLPVEPPPITPSE
jgi:hypothetical protein